MQLVTYPANLIPDWTVVTDTGQCVSVPQAHAYIHDETGTLYFKSERGSTVTAFARGRWRQVSPS